MRGGSGRESPEQDEGVPPLAALVARTMAERKLTLEQVARRGGLSIATVAAIRAGLRGKRPRPVTLYRLARGLDLPVQDLVEASGTEYVEELPEAQERVLLSLLRRLSVEDRQLAERLLRELLRTRAERSGPADG